MLPDTALMERLEEFAPAKVNLTLRVLGRRADGYHALESLVSFARFGDQLTLEPGPGLSVTTYGPFALAIDGENLVDRLGQLCIEAYPRLRLGRFSIRKSIPVAAGLGGGSADCAAAIRLIQRANPDHAPDIDWPALAISLGSDIPVCLACQPALMSGRGEQLMTLPKMAVLPIVLVNPMTPGPADKTAQVFRQLAAAPLPGPVPSPHPPNDRDIDNLEQLLATMRKIGNDLAEPAHRLNPAMAPVLAACQTLTGVQYTAAAGAGPTCLAVFVTARAARAAAADMRRLHPQWWTIATELGRPAGTGIDAP